MTERTAAESRAEYERTMGVVLGGIYAELVQELSNIHAIWGQYKILFGSKASRIELLNDAAGYFFRVVQDTMWQQVLLSISRLTDNPRVGPHQTLTVKRLAALMPDTATAAAVEAKVAIALTAEEFCRDWRNNWIGHNNLDLRVNPNPRPLAAATQKQVDEVLAALADVLNVIAGHYHDSETAFEHTITPPSDAMGLLYVLHDGVAKREEREHRLQAGHWENDYPRDL